MDNWNPDRHERLSGTPWSADVASEALLELIRELEQAWLGDHGWPPHPRDGGRRSSSQYLGTAGVVTGLRRMYEWTGQRARVPVLEIVGALRRGGAPYEAHPSLLIGRTGRELASYREEPSEENADRVLASIRDNENSSEHELMWGLAGTILAAVWMNAATADARFVQAGRAQIARLWAAWERTGDGSYSWLQTLYGERLRYVGAAHGQVGNLHALWSAAEAWPEAIDRDTLLSRTVELATSAAVDGPDGANWPSVLGEEPELVQWCHGAPGVVAALSRVPAGLSPELDALLVRGAERVWKAGPLRKGHMLCHGTAGNGFAFLKLWARTGESLWLERARAFAMHAIAQWRGIRNEFGRGWFSLWTGDVGLGVYLCACLEPSATWVGWERF